MTISGVHLALIAVLAAALPGVAAAQFPPPPPPPGSMPRSAPNPQPSSPPTTVQQRWPDPPGTPQSNRTPQPAPQPAPPQPPRRQPAAADAPTADDTPPTPRAPRPARRPVAQAPATQLTCGGAFAKDTDHLKLAVKYDSRNIVYGQVDGPDGTKLNASILFPNDPRRRLEVIWVNDAARRDISVIAINGRSQWTVPRGVKLGLPIAALEKANGRPFRLTGFGADGWASVRDWEGGALSTLPGGCKIGVRLAIDPAAPPETRAAVATPKELLSNAPSLRAAKATIGEILIGY